MALADTHSLYKITCSRPGGSKDRKDLADEVNTNNNVSDREAYGVRQRLFKGYAPYNEVVNIQTDLRKTYKEMTQPWDVRGFSIIPNYSVDKIQAAVSDARIAMSKAVSEFEQGYSSFVAERASSLGSTFRPEDYPTISELLPKFSIEEEFGIIPDPDKDVRAGWSAEQMERFKSSLKRQEAQKVAQVNRKLAEDLSSSLRGLIDKMDNYTGEKKGAFRDSVLKDVRQVAMSLGEFNLTNDPDIEKIRQAILSDITSRHPEVLRASEGERNKVKEKSKEIINKLDGLGLNRD